jgi:mono/diheme cytochrome c family protein
MSPRDPDPTSQSAGGPTSPAWLAAGCLAFAVACAAPSASAPAKPASTQPAPNAEASLIKRGEYIARASDCMSCHTAPGGRPFAGGYPLKTPYGTIYGTNITPDPETGIGGWSRADFERALRNGVRKDGAYLYPAMPYPNYTKMTAADLDALWAYMGTVPAVHNTVPKNTLPFPLSVRSGVALWQSLYFTPGPLTANAGESDAWNRGAYLVKALGHCDECHTPRNAAEGLEKGRQLTGAQIEGWYAPDISNDALSKVNAWGTQDLANFLKTGTTPGNVKVVGPMQEVVQDSLRYLTDSDRSAMAVYLKAQKSSAEQQKPTADKWRESLRAGKQLYEDHCSSCHQSDGKGRAGSIPALAGNDAVTASEPYNVIMAMLEGFPPQGTWGAMGSFADSLSDEQIADIANYVRSAWGNDAPLNATPWGVGGWRKNAQSPANEQNALLCPDLAPALIQPALNAGNDALRQAATDRGKMARLVGGYRAAVPHASRAQVIEAMSTAYCRALAPDRISAARMSAQIADFAQGVAVVLGSGKPAG